MGALPGDNDERARLATQAPFHLEATVRVLQRRPANRVDVWETNRYQRVLSTPEGLVLVEVENRGTIDDPDVRLSIRSGNPPGDTRRAIEKTVRRILGLDVDPEPLQHLVSAERKLYPVALALRGMRPPRFAGLFDAFASVIPFQQLSLDAGVAIVGRLVERFGERLEHGGRFDAFPTARAVAGARVYTLQACGLSRSKAESLRYLARAIESGELTEAAIERMGTRDALQTLIGLPGIGPWSAAVVLLRGFGRLEVFPPGDVGAARGLTELLHLRTNDSLERLIERFGDRRGYFYFFALGGNLLQKGLIHAAGR
jgi:3-methyladenine DNA glycosylase/8-oxoguanine DNA glycosylase